MEQERPSQQSISKVALIPFIAYLTLTTTVKTTAEAREREAEDARYGETVDEIEG
jgi:hypothetical protein